MKKKHISVGHAQIGRGDLFSTSAHINLANRLGYLTKQKVFNSTLVWLVVVMDWAPHVKTGSKDVAQKMTKGRIPIKGSHLGRHEAPLA